MCTRWLLVAQSVYASLSFSLLSHAARLLDQLISKFIPLGNGTQNTDKTVTEQQNHSEREIVYNNIAQQRQPHSKRAKFCLPRKRKKDHHKVHDEDWKYSRNTVNSFFTHRHRSSYRPDAVALNIDSRAEILAGSADNSWQKEKLTYSLPFYLTVH